MKAGTTASAALGLISLYINELRRKLQANHQAKICRLKHFPDAPNPKSPFPRLQLSRENHGEFSNLPQATFDGYRAATFFHGRLNHIQADPPAGVLVHRLRRGKADFEDGVQQLRFAPLRDGVFIEKPRCQCGAPDFLGIDTIAIIAHDHHQLAPDMSDTDMQATIRRLVAL